LLDAQNCVIEMRILVIEDDPALNRQVAGAPDLADAEQRAAESDAGAYVHIDRIGEAFAGHAAR
jgi:hypothetical protein